MQCYPPCEKANLKYFALINKWPSSDWVRLFGSLLEDRMAWSTAYPIVFMFCPQAVIDSWYIQVIQNNGDMALLIKFAADGFGWGAVNFMSEIHTKDFPAEGPQ